MSKPRFFCSSALSSPHSQLPILPGLSSGDSWATALTLDGPFVPMMGTPHSNHGSSFLKEWESHLCPQQLKLVGDTQHLDGGAGVAFDLQGSEGGIFFFFKIFLKVLLI